MVIDTPLSDSRDHALVRAHRTRSLDAIRRGLADSQWPLLDTTIPLREAIAASYGSRPRKLFGYDEALDELERMN